MKFKGDIVKLISESMQTDITAYGQGRRKRNIKYTKGGTIIWTQKLVQCGVTSVNGVNFDKETFERAIQDELLQTKMRENRLFGEFNHPPQDSLAVFTTIDMNNISHRINRLWFDGDALYGEMETLLTEKGNNLRGLIEQDTVITMSFRGYQVKDDYRVVTFDIVSDPSCLTAKSVEGTFNEKIYAEQRHISESSSIIHALDAGVLSIVSNDNLQNSDRTVTFAENDQKAVNKVIKDGSRIVAIVVESEEDKFKRGVSHSICDALL